KDRFKLYESGNFWLSENINAVGVKGWDAACERIATWAILKDNDTGKKFLFLNTHLDHKGLIARREGAKLILKKANELSKGYPVIVTGDFNATLAEEPIQILTDKNNPGHLTDSKEKAELKYGPEWTCHSFGRTPVENRSTIDYIFIKGNFSVLKHGVLSENAGTLYPSDHSPVMATILMK
ncbi:MAG: endonuclease/exonuclease/phosphatase family protein, partial [Bacteroidales bacterium]|nr:endonuclease/exonuclease/phosphatase family protein [Bacteroidales bacterium]